MQLCEPFAPSISYGAGYSGAALALRRLHYELRARYDRHALVDSRGK